MAETVVIPNPIGVTGAGIHVTGGGSTTGPSFSTGAGQYAVVTVLSTGSLIIGGVTSPSPSAGAAFYVPPSTSVSGTAGVVWTIFSNT